MQEVPIREVSSGSVEPTQQDLIVSQLGSPLDSIPGFASPNENLIRKSADTFNTQMGCSHQSFTNVFHLPCIWHLVQVQPVAALILAISEGEHGGIDP